MEGEVEREEIHIQPPTFLKWKHKRVCTMHHFTIHLHTIFYRQDEACEENACPAGNLDRVRIPNEMKKERNEGVTLLEC